MDSQSIWTLFVAAIGMGIGGELIRRYRAFKHRRRDMPRDARNAGFWTDSRLYHAEAVFAAAAMAIPFSAITMMIATNFNVVHSFLALLAYALAIYVLMGALNLREHD